MLPTDVVYFLNTHRIEDEEVHAQLTRHLEMVYETAGLLLKEFDTYFDEPDRIDHDLVLMGAAVHDLGKVFHPAEVTGYGNEHETLPVVMALIDAGIDPRAAYFAKLHSERAITKDLNVLLVCLADTTWNGGRDTDLELKIAEVMGGEVWHHVTRLDGICERVGRKGPKRLQYQKEGLLI